MAVHQRIYHEKWGGVSLIHTRTTTNDPDGEQTIVDEWFGYRESDGKTTRFSYVVRGDLLLALSDDPDPFGDQE